MLAAIVLLSVFLLARFNATAAERELHIVENGLERQIAELNEVVATQVNWDDAIRNLDNRFSPTWADFNVGNYLYTFNSFTHVFVVDGQDQPIYSAVNGAAARLDYYRKFAASAETLIPEIRRGEIRRGPVKPRSGEHNIVVPAIQAYSFARIEGQVFIVGATLVQPDFGKVMPRGPRAPVVIAAVPLSRAFLAEFSKRHLIDGLVIHEPGHSAESRGHVVLTGKDRIPVAELAWQPRAPGTLLLKELAVPIAAVIALLGLLAGSVMRRGAVMVNDLIASEARARHLAYHDPLTRLPNRALLFKRLGPLLADIEPGTGPVAVLCVDLDRFKDINDTLGHHAGDVLIEGVAKRLREVCSEESLIARLGGDEFVVLARSGDPARVEALAAAIIEAVRRPLESQYGKLEVGCSIGYAIVDGPDIAAYEALRRADLALYRSKDMGRMQASRFEPEMDTVLRDRRSLEADLRQALGNGELRLAYQPQVDRAGTIIAAEALLRWTHPVRGVIPPGQFVPLAEECGLIMPLGELVLRRVFAETAAWQGVRVAINVSAVQMRSQGFAALVTRLAAQAGVDPSRYEIELTETALLGDDPVIAVNVDALKRLGFSLALDDFGTGYSSLSVLQRFAVDRLKIDRSFVSSLGGKSEAEALVFAMVKLARTLRLKVIAEGVETEEQKERLVACGCDEFQGHLTGMPVPADELGALLGQGADDVRRAVNLR